MFYRVAAQPEKSLVALQGIYQYEGYNADGRLLLVGWLSVGPRHDTNDQTALAGTWGLGYVGDATCADPQRLLGAQTGKGELTAVILGEKFLINLTPKYFNYSVILDGSLQNGAFNGTWRWQIHGVIQTNGTFSAQRLLN